MNRRSEKSRSPGSDAEPPGWSAPTCSSRRSSWRPPPGSRRTGASPRARPQDSGSHQGSEVRIPGPVDPPPAGRFYGPAAARFASDELQIGQFSGRNRNRVGESHRRRLQASASAACRKPCGTSISAATRSARSGSRTVRAGGFRPTTLPTTRRSSPLSPRQSA